MKRSLFVAATLLTVAGCSGSSGGGESSCALALEHDGRTYHELRTARPVTGARPLTDVHLSTCDDTGGQEDPGSAEADDAAERLPARALDGVDPAVAIVVPSRWPHALFYAGPSDASSFPPEVQRLLGR